jgi:hypothetical protein
MEAVAPSSMGALLLLLLLLLLQLLQLRRWRCCLQGLKARDGEVEGAHRQAYITHGLPAVRPGVGADGRRLRGQADSVLHACTPHRTDELSFILGSSPHSERIRF